VDATRDDEDETPLREIVERGELIREDQWVSQREDDKTGAEADGLRVRGDEGEKGGRVDEARLRGPVALPVGEDDVLFRASATVILS
jgi:hypothetical protein